MSFCAFSKKTPQTSFLCGYAVCVCVSSDPFPKTPPSPHPLETYLHSQLHPSNAVEFAIDDSSARKWLVRQDLTHCFIVHQPYNVHATPRHCGSCGLCLCQWFPAYQIREISGEETSLVSMNLRMAVTMSSFILILDSIPGFKLIYLHFNEY